MLVRGTARMISNIDMKWRHGGSTAWNVHIHVVTVLRECNHGVRRIDTG